MSSDFDYGSLMRKTLYGAVAGGAGGAGIGWFSNDKSNKSTLIGTGLGAGLGAYLDIARQNKARKEDASPVLDNIPEGLYYGEGGLYGNITAFKGTPVNKLGRHGFIAGVFNQAPEGIESMQLPNGQYAVTFSGIPTLSFGLPNGGFYATINGKSKVKGSLSDIDYRILSSAVNREAKLNGNYYPKLYPLVNDRQVALEKINRINQILKNKLNRSLGKYNIMGNSLHRNDCLSLAGYLMSRVGIDKNKLPERLGYFGSILTDDMDLYDYDSPTIMGDVKAAGWLDYFKPKTKQNQTQNQQQPQDAAKNQEETENTTFSLFKKKTPEEQLREEFEEYVIRNNPKLWNIYNEKDKFPKSESRSNLISLLGLGTGALYGLGKGYFNNKENPKSGVPGIISSGVGYGALGFGLATTGNMLARGIGTVAGKYGKPRTKEQQAEYDSRRQLYSSLPGFDAYNEQLRKRVLEEDLEKQE